MYGRWADCSSEYNILDYDDGELTQIHTLWKTLFNLVDLLKYSEENGSPIYLSTNVPVKRYKSKNDEIQQKSDLTQIYKININDMGYLPHVKSIEDVLRLREDKRILPLRDALAYWEEEVRKGDVSALAIAKKEVEKAQRMIKKLDKYIPGEIIGHAPLPIGCENYMTPFFPFGLLPIGKEESVYSQVGLKKFSWINFIMCEE